MPATSSARRRAWVLTLRAACGLLATDSAWAQVASESQPVSASEPVDAEVQPVESDGNDTARDAAADVVNLCLANHAAGQEARFQGHLMDAARMFTLCSKSECPGLVRDDCAPWLHEVEVQLPSIAFEFEPKVAPADVHVIMDGQAVEWHIGDAHTVDPGPHDFRFEVVGYPPVVQRLLLRAGESRRTYRIGLERVVPEVPVKEHDGRGPPSQEPDEIPDTRHSARWIWLFGGVSAVGFGVAAYFGVKSFDEKASLQSRCAPLCSNADLEVLRERRLTADVGLGVGVLGATLATAFYVMREREAARPVVAALASRWQFSVAPSAVSIAMEKPF